MQIKIEDTVQVISGDDRGVRGKVLAVDRKTGKLLVEGVNQVYKHVQKSQRNPQGGRLSKEMPVQISNVLIVCEKCHQPSRLGVRFSDEGAKQRFCKKCGANLGQVAPPRAAYAKNK